MSIEVKELSKLYGTQKALNNISFSVNKGEIVGFLGPNGAGKSTLMKILTTYLAASEGDAKVSGYDVKINKQDVQRNVGYLPEHNPLYLDMYVKEYLSFNAGVYNISKSKIQEVIELTGLTPESHKKISSLSKGYRQRVGLANALLHDPSVLILDEPTTGLDPNQLVDIRRLIKSIGQDKTVFLSTHIMQEVEAICDRVIIINKGSIVADKKLNELRDDKEQTVIVEFDYRVEDTFLMKLPNAKSVKNTVDFVYEITFSTSEDMRSHVFDFAHDNELKILQLNQKNASLESLFRDLTTE
ncbi:gliding motility-associated ABC transporter ATP-binding subunit GldA [Psychroserpens sp.]|uniref:gliding motility-associated ABC transporter ATP-binding subunit GldA n=1 Tax=Psychroserpens sp. TaxID=2020870 RepID=UPI001B29BA73|nr:gliding motility-associated ABC transporter ATP-binding subunit GldA [Psychroserpens sp.]MBO6607927.1 gliding motility-associated ABC transporter ATP-binding subunit GldA [Psychroserpens sp.]MBO6654946.1 gliding motility-associated ABC transporter ATP-binding subunit GldA [Psychroserpens sp.]MBO6682980.1 gliding motility-associated ABC transporter ATP-binding subunit GldA [Psychroserpens sp.]MBO6751285.1 gliding motility-associated ABC transporter ATP-binding subunit GldA [Psychroserpens sp.